MTRSEKPTGQSKPSRAELLASAGKTVPDVIGPGLKVLFCGINPGLYTAWAGHHFARPGNRFWPALFAAGFTNRLLRPHEQRELLTLGYGITNLAARPTAASDELSEEELVAGGRILVKKARTYKPQVVAVLGVSAYRVAFSEPHASIGLRPKGISGSELWVLPNPSGLNAHFTPKALAGLFTELRRHLENT